MDDKCPFGRERGTSSHATRSSECLDECASCLGFDDAGCLPADVVKQQLLFGHAQNVSPSNPNRLQLPCHNLTVNEVLKAALPNHRRVSFRKEIVDMLRSNEITLAKLGSSNSPLAQIVGKYLDGGQSDILGVAAERIHYEEGFRGKPYTEKVSGNLTVGYGTDLVASPLTGEEGLFLLHFRMERKWAELTMRRPWLVELPDAAKIVLIDMAYQMGVSGLLKFKRMFGALQQGDFGLAAEELLDSRYAKQTPRRAHRNKGILQTLIS